MRLLSDFFSYIFNACIALHFVITNLARFHETGPIYGVKVKSTIILVKVVGKSLLCLQQLPVRPHEANSLKVESRRDAVAVGFA